jgi:hypothetical protein
MVSHLFEGLLEPRRAGVLRTLAPSPVWVSLPGPRGPPRPACQFLAIFDVEHRGSH